MLDQETLFAVLKACREDYARLREEFGGSDTAASEVWGLGNVETIISQMLKESGKPEGPA